MENKLYDVTAFGELLIDFTENGTVPREILCWKQTRAVLHATCLPCLKAWQKNCIYRKSWKRYVRKQLKNAVEEVGIDTRNLVMDDEVHTTLAFVHTYPDGDEISPSTVIQVQI